MSAQNAKNLLQFTVLGLTLWILFNQAKEQGSLPVATSTRQSDGNPSPPSGIGSGFGGVGRVETFPVTSISHEQVQGTAAEMLDSSLTSGPVEVLAEWILTEHGLDFQPTAEAAMALTDYVNRSLPTHSDPQGRESMTDPESIAVMLLRGQVPAYFDCDDKTMLLAALARSIGLEATVVFFDLTGNGMIDHAMTMINVPGRGPTLAETTDPSKPLGWEPDYVTIEYLVV